MHGEQQADDHAQHRTQGRAVKAVEQGEHGCGGLLARGLQYRATLERAGGCLLGDRQLLVGLARLLLILQCSTAKHRHPQDRHQRRDQQGAKHQFADGAATGDACNEQPHERAPGHPPRPVEGSPALLPGAVGLGVGPEAHADDVLRVVTGRFEQQVHQVVGRAQCQHHQHQPQGNPHVQRRKALHAARHAGHQRDRGNHGDDGDDAQLERQGDRGAEHLVHAHVDLLHAQPQRLRDAKGGDRAADDVHGMPDRPVDAVADQRVEDRAQRQRQPFTVGEVGQAQADHGEDCPRVQAPVQQGDAHGHGCGLVGEPRGKRVAGIVQHRLGHRPEDQPHAHAGAEQHGDPGGEAEFRFFVGTPELQGAKAAEGDEHQHPEDAADQRQVEPFQVVEDGVGGGLEYPGGLVAIGGAEHHEGHDNGKRPNGHNRIQALEQAFFCTHRLYPFYSGRQVQTHPPGGVAG
ncbi:hypothetical protein D3C75_673600 [compost metagenome]